MVKMMLIMADISCPLYLVYYSEIIDIHLPLNAYMIIRGGHTQKHTNNTPQHSSIILVGKIHIFLYNDLNLPAFKSETSLYGRKTSRVWISREENILN